jgi:hypothetical protein
MTRAAVSRLPRRAAPDKTDIASTAWTGSAMRERPADTVEAADAVVSAVD